MTKGTTTFYLTCILLCLALWIGESIYAQSKAKLSRVSVNGNKFVTAEGKVIVFRGLCTSDPDKLSRDGHWNKEYFEAAKSWGANIVRFPVHPTVWRRQGKEAYLKLLDEGVRWATDLGL